NRVPGAMLALSPLAPPRLRHSRPTRRSSDLARQRQAHPLPPAIDEARRALARLGLVEHREGDDAQHERREDRTEPHQRHGLTAEDRKSTRLNSSHVKTSYADFCLKKKRATKS